MVRNLLAIVGYIVHVSAPLGICWEHWLFSTIIHSEDYGSTVMGCKDDFFDTDIKDVCFEIAKVSPEFCGNQDLHTLVLTGKEVWRVWQR